MESAKQAGSDPAPKTETVEKRETRSRHEKKRREEMNEVLKEMMDLLPDDVRKVAFKLKRSDQKPKRPDKCFIIGNAVDFIKKNGGAPPPTPLPDPLIGDIFDISNCFLMTLRNFVIAGINGESRSIFDVEKDRMIGKDIRCFLDFESATKLSFLTFNTPPSQPLILRSFMAKSMTCRTKISDQNPTETTLICVPNEPPRILSAPPLPLNVPKCEMDRPILAALLRRKDPQPVLENQNTQAPIRVDTASTSSSSFLSPSSSTSATIPIPAALPPKKKPKSEKRKRLRSVNVIVESYSLDEVESKPKVMKTSGSDKNVAGPAPPPPPSTTLPTILPGSIPAPLTIHQIPHGNLVVNPYDVLAPGYKDIWLRLQSERLLLEERIVAKEGELKNLMLNARTLPHYIPTLGIPQYTFPQTTLDLIAAQNP